MNILSKYSPFCRKMQEQGENCLRVLLIYDIITENGGLCMEKDAFTYPELHYFKSGNTYSGSYKGLNYILTPDDETLHIAVWYGMYCSAVSSTPPARKTHTPTATHAAAHTKTAAAAMSFASFTMLS